MACEINRAATFLAAFQFNQDDVYTWCIFYKNVSDIFAADILHHNDCMANYVLKFNEIWNDMESDVLFSAAVHDLSASVE